MGHLQGERREEGGGRREGEGGRREGEGGRGEEGGGRREEGGGRGEEGGGRRGRREGEEGGGRREGEEEGEEGGGGRGEEGGGVQRMKRERRKWRSISESCMTVALTIDPYLYYWVTVDLDSFVVHLNRKPSHQKTE